MKLHTPAQSTMPIGKYKGQLISTLATQFLFWFLSQENLRFKYGDTARSAMAELRARFNAPGLVESELMPADAGDLV